MLIELAKVLRLLLASALAAVIGVQRERAGKPAGLRTHTIICLCVALLTMASIYGFGAVGYTSKVTAGVVAGIGFIGAGVIIRGGEGAIAGLTAADTIWSVAGIGLTAGAGLYRYRRLATP